MQPNYNKNKRYIRQILDIAAERTEISEESDTRRKKIELEEKKRISEVDGYRYQNAVQKIDEVRRDINAVPEIVNSQHLKGSVLVNPMVDNAKSTQREALSMSACAKRLQKSVRLISLDKALYYFNGLCYQIIDNEGLIELYRKNVDDELHGAKTLKLFSEVYDYLLTDSKIRVKPDEENISNFVVLKNGIYDLRDKELKNIHPRSFRFPM